MMTDFAVSGSASKWIWICWIRMYVDLHENGHLLQFLLHAITACSDTIDMSFWTDSTNSSSLKNLKLKNLFHSPARVDGFVWARVQFLPTFGRMLQGSGRAWVLGQVDKSTVLTCTAVVRSRVLCSVGGQAPVGPGYNELQLSPVVRSHVLFSVHGRRG